MRNTLTIAAATVVVLGIIAGVYFFFFYHPSPTLTADTASSGNPFGTSGAQTGTSGTSGTGDGSDTGADTSGNIPAQVAPKLVEVSSVPVGEGFIALDPAASTTASSTDSVAVRYIDRQSGNMYEYAAATNSSTRLTNHTVPGVEEASWLPDGSAAYLRFISTGAEEHINTYELPADGSDGSFLVEDLSQVIPQSVSSVFTLAPNSSGSIGYVERPDGTSPATLFSSLLSSLTVKSSAGVMVAFTKPSANLEGYGFLVNQKTGAFTSVLGPLKGLSMLPSPSGTRILESYIDAGGTLRLAFYDMTNHATTILPLSTITEKCVWASDDVTVYCAAPTSIPTATLPDDWYQGTVSFTDRIWKIDFTARVATLAADLPTLVRVPIDATALTIDRNESTLVFMNKSDDTLWAYSL